jgi:hypothetical protein
MNGHVPVAEQMARGLPKLRILWAAMFASTVLLFVVSRVVVLPGRTQPPSSPIGPSLFVSACLIGAFGVYFPFSVLARLKRRQKMRFALVLTPTIVGLALTEAIAVSGLELTFLGAAGGYALPLFGISWVGFVARFPTATRPLGLLGPRLDWSDAEPESAADAIR